MLNFRLIENNISIEEFLELRKSVGLNELPKEQVEKMIRNSIYAIVV